MDVDAMNQDHFDPVSLFDISPNGFPWRDPVPREIEARRALMSDVLLFDLVLRGGGIRNTDILYPPTDVHSLRTLLKAIEDSNYDTLKQECLVYFLLKWHNDGRDQVYKVKKCLPAQFVALSDAYWFLDTGLDVPRAVSLLSDARLIRDFTSKILEAISITNNPNPLILRYMRAAEPRLTEPNDIDTYTIALLHSSLLEAWQYQRSFPEGGETRSRLICNILKWCLSPKPRSKPLSQLLGFSITPYEQSLIHAYALRPPTSIPPSSIPVLQHLAVVRLIEAGQYASAVKLDHQFSLVVPSSYPSSNGHSFTPSMVEAVRKGTNNRKAMIKEIMDVIPRVEKELLELDLEKMSANASSSSSSTLSSSYGDLSGSGLSFGSGLGSSGLDMSMSMSWESVRGSGAAAKDSPSASFVKVPKSNGADSPNSSFGLANKKTSSQKQGTAIDQESNSPMRRSRLSDAQVAPIPQRSGAPRFGGPVPSVQSSPAAVNGGGISAVLRAARGIPQFTVSLGTSQAQTQKTVSSPNGQGQGERRSLFETVGSANRIPNAFYEPPSTQPQSTSVNASATSAGVKRPFGAVSGISARVRRGTDVGVEDLSSASAGAVVQELLAEDAKSDEEVEMDGVDEAKAQNGKATTRDSGPKDVEMGSDEEVPSISAKSKGKGKAKARQSLEGMDEDQPQTRSRTGSDEHSREFHISIFSPSPPVESPPRFAIVEPLSPMGGLSPGRARVGGKLALRPSDMDVFPGAFIHDETESQVNFGSGRHHHASPPPPLPATPIAKPRRSEAAAKKPVTKSKTGAVKKERKKARTSFPGALITDDEDEDEQSHSAVDSEDELLLKSPSKQSAKISHRTRRAARSSDFLSNVDAGQRRDLEDESEDVVMPLPPVTPARRQPARKTRASTGTTPRKDSSATTRKSSRRESVPTKVNAETTRATRRSSRLSNAGSESPEPPSLSPVKRRTGGSTKASSGSGGGAGISAGVSGGVSKKREGKKGKS